MDDGNNPREVVESNSLWAASTGLVGLLKPGRDLAVCLNDVINPMSPSQMKQIYAGLLEEGISLWRSGFRVLSVDCCRYGCIYNIALDKETRKPIAPPQEPDQSVPRYDQEITVVPQLCIYPLLNKMAGRKK